MEIKYPLAKETINEEDIDALCDWLKSYPRLTKGALTPQGERKWADFIGTRHAVFNNSGSSANLLMIYTAIAAGRIKNKKIVVPSVGWVTTLAPAIQFGLEPIMVEADEKTFGIDLDELEKVCEEHNPDAVIFVQVLGVPHHRERLLQLKEKYGFTLLEDACAALGASYGDGSMGGTGGDMASFSFYFGHQLSTIEGGMVCTNDESLYERLLLLRSHGLMRELPTTMQEKYKDLEVDENFTFLLPGFNVRSTEINAVLGLEQLKDLDTRIKIRNDNFNQFCDLIDKSKYECSFDMEGISNFCFPILRKDGNMNDIKKLLKENNIHVRPIIAGNLYEHPFIKNVNMKRYDNHCSYINDCGLYVGNNHMINSVMIKRLCEMLEGI